MSHYGAGALEQLLAEAREDLRQADFKASILLASFGVGYGAIFGGLFLGEPESNYMLTSAGLFILGGFFAGACSLGFAILAVWPRYKLMEIKVGGATYWGEVAKYKTLSQFIAANASKPISRDFRTEQQLWRVSRLVRLKYSFVRASLIFALLASTVWGAAFFIRT